MFSALRKPPGCFTRCLQGCHIQQTYLLIILAELDILLYHILCEIELKGTDCVGCNCNLILALFTAGKRNLCLYHQLLFLYLRDILADNQRFHRLSILPFQADDVHMLPLFLPIPHHMALKPHIAVF